MASFDQVVEVLGGILAAAFGLYAIVVRRIEVGEGYQGQVRKIYKPSFFDGGVSVYVNLDPNDKYLSSEFHSSFTFL